MEPHIADTSPIEVNLTEGEEIWFCSCGKSENQPFCDGSHKGTGISPLAYIPKETGSAWFCQCKRSSTLPFCDGSHKKL